MHALEHTADNGRSHFRGVVDSRLQAETWMRPAIDPKRVYAHTGRHGALTQPLAVSFCHGGIGARGISDDEPDDVGRRTGVGLQNALKL